MSYVLGGHIEQTQGGKLFPSGSTYHPAERPVQMEKADSLALPAALGHFNGFRTQTDRFTLINPIHNLIAAVTVALILLSLLDV